jgi:hypothetical protein
VRGNPNESNGIEGFRLKSADATNRPPPHVQRSLAVENDAEGFHEGVLDERRTMLGCMAGKGYKR